MMINNKTEMKGILPINKPIGWTSFDVCNKLKHLLKTPKIGHLGTLDPMASGVLLVTVGKATKLFDLFQEKHKTYLAKFKFGYLTDSLDATGNILKENGLIPTEEEILSVLPKFVGEINQIPPQFSAKSINGKRAYDLARDGKTVDLKPCKVTIYNIKLLNYANAELTLQIECGSGTYIRSIGRDIATELDTFGTMT
ncbi:MAG: tRNA pseudouridine(55) synthase TruB, partial [Clostridia bacterium]|nr:tRNA pseudouridine(55) synthase TruB [Clostridia bacterium]